MKNTRRASHIDAPKIRLCGSRVLGERGPIVVHGNLVDRPKRVFQLDELYFFDLAEWPVEQEREDMKLEKPRIESERSEHGRSDPPTVDRGGECVAEHFHGDRHRCHQVMFSSCRETVLSESRK